MNNICKDFVEYITKQAPKHNKQALEEAVREKFNLTLDRKVYHNECFAVRFSYSKRSSESFSNTVLSLSTLEKYDKIPFFVVLVRREADNLILLSNSTFLKKISQSSQLLSETNIRGSFNGSDIIRSYAGKANTPENFDFLFAIHQATDWKDNLLRLVEATSSIKPKKQPFEPTAEERVNIFGSIRRAMTFVESDNFCILKEDLDERCNRCRNEIISTSHFKNTNIRGRLIESLITADEEERQKIVSDLRDTETELPSYDTKNGLGDYYREFNNWKTYTDIKTKIVYLDSNPKAFNIDKFLRQMADAKSIFLFYFIGVDENSIFSTALCSVYHSELIDGTILQHHWAGRSTRGVAQYNGAVINEILKEQTFVNDIDERKASLFLEELLKTGKLS